LPEVSLVAILDADKEGFLRSHRSLTQTAGRAARNVNGKVIMYADTITESMQKTIDETNRRRTVQLKYNEEHHITPTQIVKAINNTLTSSKDQLSPDQREIKLSYGPVSINEKESAFAADPIEERMSKAQLQKRIVELTNSMKEAAKQLDFLQAAQYRDEIIRLQDLLDKKE
jgi:excinuclease ABC subunit B